MAERRILITGASSGIGAATARAMAVPGAAIAVHCRANRAGADLVAAELRAAGAEAVVLMGDLTEPATAARLVEQAVAALGGLEVVVANAGFADRTPVSALTDEGFARSADTVLWGFLRLARAAGPHLVKAGKAGGLARMVAISSFVAHSFRTDTTVFPASAAAKAGVEALVRSLAIEWAPDVTVNAVVPGYTRKDAGAHAALDPAAWDAILPRIPLRRLGTPADVAAAVAFLASPGAAYITGQALHVSGGVVM
ncbi:SDR family NAD(P)-dependent oxidoreductase [Roseomonas chloroacetimidivorans]|jgi:NAD(P)-dependent dehydrogenase (short-subunit alcohol dehydrogenase family)|uniref:SDR family NAD(P)-dependent oxidoreductase n=1 Tax=Roseomonas chloroacetimidivorans TaxID=1766656 RepID=UPI003C71DE32